MDYENIQHPDQVKFISGAATFADMSSEVFANAHRFDVMRFPIDCDSLGNKDTYARNMEMMKYAIADGNYGVLIAFWDGKSKDTKHMIDLAEKYGLEVHIVRV